MSMLPNESGPKQLGEMIWVQYTVVAYALQRIIDHPKYREFGRRGIPHAIDTRGGDVLWSLAVGNSPGVAAWAPKRDRKLAQMGIRH